MDRYWRTWRIRLALGLFVVSVAYLLWISNKPLYGLTDRVLLQLMSFQSVVALAISSLSSVVIAILQRSFKAGGIVLLGVFFGTTVGGTVGLASGVFVSGAMDWMFPVTTDPDLPNLGAGIVGVVVWFFGQVVGALWGGEDWLALYTSNRRRRGNYGR